MSEFALSIDDEIPEEEKIRNIIYDTVI